MYKVKAFLLGCVTILSGCDNYDGMEQFSSSGEFVTSLPSNSVPGDLYPVSFIAKVDRQLSADANSLIYKDNVEVQSSEVDCLNETVEGQYICAISLRVTPLANGPASVELDIEGQRFLNQTFVTQSAVIGHMHSNTLQTFNFQKDKFEAGKSHPVDLVFTNIGSEVANNIDISSLFERNLTDVKSTCGTSLEAGEGCYVHGNYTPEATDVNGIKYSLTYDEGEQVTVGAKNVLNKERLVGRVIRNLPFNIASSTSYDVEFRFSNLGTEPVTNIRTQLLAPSVSEIRFDECQDNALAVGESCAVTASVVGDEIGTLTALVGIQGDNGDSASATVVSNVVESPIVAHVEQDLPQKMALGATYDYLVTFTNQSNSHDATGVRFAHLYPESYSVHSNTCVDSTLKAEESCHISLSTTAQSAGIQHYSSYLMFDQGTAVISSSTLSRASERSIESVIDLDFPSNMLLNQSYPFHATFTNNGLVDTDLISITSMTTQNVLINSNTCEGEKLQPGTSCQLSGEYYTTQLGPVRLEGNLNYGPNLDEAFNFSSEVVAVPIHGSVKVGLPKNIGLNNTYPISYVYQNLSAVHDASMINVTLSSTAPVHVATNTCESKTILHPGEECEISGEFTATQQGLHQFQSSMTYKEGNAVKINSSAIVSDVVVSSQVEGSLPIVGLGQTYPVRYVFNNESIVEASGIQISHSANLNITSDSCGTTLTGGSQCEIVAEYSPSQNGQFVHTLTFDYVEGNEIELTQPVKVVDAIALDEVVYQVGSLSHSFDAADYFNYASDYGFTILTKLQTLDISGNPEKVVYAQWGGTDMDIELTPSEPMTFTGHRVNNCSTRSMNSTIGCASGKLSSLRLTLNSDSFNALPSGEQSGVIYITLTQSNNTHVAVFGLPIRVIK